MATLAASLLKLPASSTPLLVGLSGGLDSTVLLHALANGESKGVGLRAIHVNHGLQPQAHAWASHCLAFCKALDVELTIASTRVERNSGIGPEAAAREARYRVFSDELREGERLVLAHHRDDQAETMLLRLLRGSGSDGLAAMRPLRNLARGVLWRPLLDVPRSDLLAYAQLHQLQWIEDPSNCDIAMDRNFLRHRILPALAERWPQASQSFARSAILLAEDSLLLAGEADKRLALVQGLDPHTLSVTALLAVEPAWRPRILRKWLAALNLPSLPGAAFAIIENELLTKRRDAEPEYRWAGTVLRCWRDILHVEIERPAIAQDWQSEWNGDGELLLASGGSLRFLPVTNSHSTTAGAATVATETTTDSITSDSASLAAAEAAPTGFFVRSRRGGERITLPGRGHTHSLKKLLPELGIPPWERQRLPLLFAPDGALLAAGDVLISALLQAWCREHGKYLCWRP